MFSVAYGTRVLTIYALVTWSIAIETELTIIYCIAMLFITPFYNLDFIPSLFNGPKYGTLAAVFVVPFVVEFIVNNNSLALYDIVW
jgi:hypothetical protein